jgi:hypothetical protein
MMPAYHVSSLLAGWATKMIESLKVPLIIDAYQIYFLRIAQWPFSKVESCTPKINISNQLPI